MAYDHLRYAGIVESSTYNIHGRAIVARDDGVTVGVAIDPNQAGSNGGDGTGVTKVYVYRSPIPFGGGVANTNWSLEATLTPAVGLHISSTNDSIYCVGIGSTNKIYVVYRGTSQEIRMLILNETTFAIESDEQVLAAAGLPAGGAWIAFDISIMDTPENDADSVLVAIQWTSTGATKIGTSVMMRRPSDNTWQLTVNVNDSVSAAIEQPNAFGCVAVSWIKGPTTNATMRFALARGIATTASDLGVYCKIYGVNGQSGTVSTVIADPVVGGGANTFDTAGSVTTSDKKHRIIDIFCDGSNTFVLAIAEGPFKAGGRFTIRRISVAGVVGATYLGAVSPSYAGVGGGGGGAVGLSQPHYFSFGHNDAGQTIIGCHYSSADSTVYTRIAKMTGIVLTWTQDYVLSPGISSSYDFISFPKIMVNPDSSGWLHHHEHEAFGLMNDGQTLTSRSFAAIYFDNNVTELDNTPAAGSTVTTSEPTLTAKYENIGDIYSQSKLKIEFQLDTNSGFNTGNLRTIIQADSKFYLVDPTVEPQPILTETIAPTQALTQGNWYLRARVIDEFGNKGPWWTDGATFAVSHPPTATLISPVDNQIIPYISGDVILDWGFSDPYYSDSQTALQVEVQRVDTSAVVYNSGWQTSPNTAWQVNIAAGLKDVPLKWKVMVKDEDGIAGAWTGFGTFTVVDPPSVVITAPDGVTDVTSPQVAATFTPTVAGGRTIVAYRVQVSQAGLPIFDSGTIVQGAPTATGVPIIYNSGVSLYENNNNYTLTVTVTDSVGLLGGATQPLTTDWIPPDPPDGVAVTDLNFNVENEGYLSLIWDDSERDADFVKWVVYRKLDEVDESGAVIEAGSFEKVEEIFITAANYEYRDYFAPAGKKVSYKVEQSVNRFGDLLESETVTVVTVTPQSDGYWLIEPLGPDGTADAFRLSIVTGDDYTDEYEEAEFTVIGRGRYVDRGDALGLKGQLSAQLRNTGGTTARQKKRRLEKLKLENRNLYLRTPYGDVYRVSVGNISVSRLAGMGEFEFVNVGIPYSEVTE